VPKYLIDANLPYRFSLWEGSECVHVFDLSDSWTDLQIWDYARRNDLTIVGNDADFSALAMASDPPPRVVHLRIGNLRFHDLRRILRDLWPQVLALSETHRLITVFRDRIEGVR
jgi:predicted nuclease of predicted toxin-antitoxin system